MSPIDLSILLLAIAVILEGIAIICGAAAILLLRK